MQKSQNQASPLSTVFTVLHHLCVEQRKDILAKKKATQQLENKLAYLRQE